MGQHIVTNQGWVCLGVGPMRVTVAGAPAMVLAAAATPALTDTGATVAANAATIVGVAGFGVYALATTSAQAQVTSESVPASSLSAVRRRIVSQHGGWLVQAVTGSNGTTQLSGTDLIRFGVNTRCTDLQFLLANGTVSNSGQMTPTGNPITMFFGLLNYNVVLPVQFRGLGAAGAALPSAEIGFVLPDNALVLSEPISVADATADYLGGGFQPGGAYSYVTYHAVTSGQKWPHHHVTTEAAWASSRTTDFVYGTGKKDGSDLVWPFSNVNTLASAGNAFAATAYAHGAVAIIGRQLEPAVVAMICGHSITAGAASTQGLGWIGAGLQAAGVAFHNDGLAGAALYGQARYGQVTPLLAEYVDYVILQGATNDFFSVGRSFAQTQTALLAWCKMHGRAHNKIVLCAELPRSASTDNWATLANQTTQAAEPVRLAWNNWLRDKTSTGAVAWLNARANGAFTVAPFVIDPTPGVERSADGSVPALDANGQQTSGTGGLWISSGVATYYTTDGIHPNPPSVALLSPYAQAAAVNLVLF